MPRVTFKIHYSTRAGETLLLERRTAPDRIRSIALVHTGDGHWSAAVDDAEAGDRFEYRYALKDDTGGWTHEPFFRVLSLPGSVLTVIDEWFSPELPEAAFRRQAFAGIIFNPDVKATPCPGSDGRHNVKLTVCAPRVTRGHRICISGSSRFLGNWDPARAGVMSGASYPIWEIELPLSDAASPHEFKFGLWSDADQRLVRFEDGANRRLDPGAVGDGPLVVNCACFRDERPWKGAGVAIPVFALRSECGYGVGEFADLAPFAAWAARCGMHLVQVLPINDTSADFTWRDSYPYKAISTAALHPIYLNIESLFTEHGLPLPTDHAAKRDALNRLPQLDYEVVLSDKLAWLRQLYATAKAATLRSAPFQAFFREQSDWLQPYAAFCQLRDRHGTPDFSRWGDDAVFSPEKVRTAFEPGSAAYDEVMFHVFVQFHLKVQLDRALAAGHAVGVAFKGDLPIGIDRCSVEAWTTPALFHMDRQTGAPPDSFSALGQNWGFPTYDWPRMEAERYAWWRQRLARMSACFDALRIDHILGFFRIWEIPREQTEGILGHFNPAMPLSREEIREQGFTREVGDFVVPAAAHDELPRFFEKAAPRIARALLKRGLDGFHRFKAAFAAEASRDAWTAATFPKDQAGVLAGALKRLSYEVLFVPDPDQPDRFHPRIALRETALFQSLEPAEQKILRTLHDDYFYRRHTRFWEAEAMKKLPALMDATNMLICGEDLGMIPDSVPVVLKRLGLLSLEVQSMPKRFGQRFGDPAGYPYLSVCTTSTHDTPTVRGWWEEEDAARQDYWRDVMGQDGEAPREATPEIVRFIINRSLAGGSMWCVLPLQDWLGIDPRLRRRAAAEERINVPAIPRHYWRYRMHLTLEQLQRAEEFNRDLAQLIADCGRHSRE